MPCTILYHLYNLKNVKNTHGGALFVAKLQVSGCHGCYLRFLDCTDGTKSRNASHLLSIFNVFGGPGCTSDLLRMENYLQLGKVNFNA